METKQVQHVQAVETVAELLALDLANLLVNGKREKAQETLNVFVAANNPVYWEVIAIADMAKAMSNNKGWKK